MGKRRIRAVDPELAKDHERRILARIADEVGRRYLPQEPGPDGPRWENFREGRNRTRHARRMFVAKYNAAYWGEPWNSPDLWDPITPTTWVGDEPGGAISCPDLGSAMVGDLIVVMRVEYRDKGLSPSDDPSPFRGKPKLLGVLHVVQVQTQRFAHGPSRPTTQLWHRPLVRFADDDVVDVDSMRSMDPNGVGRIAPFTTANWTLVACRDGNEAALLASACSLPSEVFTTRDLVALSGRLAGSRCGMQAQHRKYWQNIRYKHEVIELIAETAVRVASRNLANQGWHVDSSKQRVPKWGGDLDCERRDPSGQGRSEKLCVEVKGTRYLNWRGRVHLQVPQRLRAIRAASGRLRPEEVGYDWEMHVQSGIPTNHRSTDDPCLPGLHVIDASWVHANWKDSWTV